MNPNISTRPPISHETPPTEVSTNKILEDAFKILETGKSVIKLDEQYKDYTLILGGTGAGKSTFLQWITDDTKLKAKEKVPGDFLIYGDKRIGESVINANTIFPEREIDDTINVVYDCPGFDDTRGASYDLATTYLIKQVADYANSVKMIFLINFSSVRYGVDRTDFMRLLKHVSDLVKNIDKFKNSMALVVTKVDYITVLKEGKLTTLDDESTIQNVAEFLKSVKGELLERIKCDNSPERKCLENATKIIDILLTKDRGTFTRIGLFRRPLKEGPLTESIFHYEKNIIRKIIFEKLDFGEKTEKDFGYGLSEKTKNDTNVIVEEIHEKLQSTLRKLALHVQCHFEMSIRKIIERIVSRSTNVRVQQTEENELRKLRNAKSIFKELVTESGCLKDLNEIVEIVNTHISRLDIVIPKGTMELLTFQGKYITFLQAVCEKKFNVSSWKELFKDTLFFLKQLEDDFQNHIRETVKTIKNKTIKTSESLAKVMREEYRRKFELLDIKSLLDMLGKEKTIWFAKIEQISEITDRKELADTFSNIGRDLSIDIPKNITSSILKLKQDLLFLESSHCKEINSEYEELSIKVSLKLQTVSKFINDTKNWYKFLYDLYNRFSEHTVQKEKLIYNVQNINDWKKSGVPGGIKISFKNFHEFLDKISNSFSSEYSEMKTISLSESNLAELNHMLSLTLKNKINIYCTETSITIKGDYISIKNIFSNEYNAYINDESLSFKALLGSRKLKTIIFYASSTIFIDEDIEFVGRLLSVFFIAPRWEIIGIRKIDLSGSEGNKPSSIYPPLSSNITGDDKTEKAKDGEPGKPGGLGGNFFGIGETFIKGENLSIFTNGGIGGAGQKGQDGKNGRDSSLGGTSNKTWNTGLRRIEALGNVALIYTSGGVWPLVGVFTTQALGILLKKFPVLIEKGEKGMRGGDGGRGGEGGNPGNIFLQKLNTDSETHNYNGKDEENSENAVLNSNVAESVIINNSEENMISERSVYNYCADRNDSSGIQKYNNKGKMGQNGAGGRGGLSGFNTVITGKELEGVIVCTTGRDPPAEDGANGVNCKGLEQPDVAPVFNSVIKRIIIDDYKSYLRENLNDRFKRHNVMQFLKLLDPNTKDFGFKQKTNKFDCNQFLIKYVAILILVYVIFISFFYTK